MFEYVRERVAYRRMIRCEAERLIAAHGPKASALAANAAAVERDPVLRGFRAAVAVRVARALGETPLPGVRRRRKPVAPSAFDVAL